ncbi:hypothetical protein QYF36_019647 [Acer negundo]|nr:hypothetical protein QYF36_019647 [Acer negundo]
MFLSPEFNPAFLVDLKQWYTTEYGDYLFAEKLLFLFLWPLSIVNIFFVDLKRRLARTPLPMASLHLFDQQIKKRACESEFETAVVTLEEFQEMLDELFLLCLAKMKGLMEDFVPQDMVDLLLQLADDPNLEVKLNYDSVRGFMQLNYDVGRE